MSMILLTSILLSTIAYSAFSTRLQIKGDAVLRVKKDIRITGIKLTNHTGSAYETYASKYSTDTTSMYVTLPANSTAEYTITITNNSDSDYIVSKITQLSHNSNVSYTNSLKVNDVIENASGSGPNKTFIIKISNSTSIQQTETLFLQYVFEEFKGTFATYLQSLSASSTIISDDGTADHNMRYTGSSPNNYVTFAGEEWRVIGVFNNIENGTGKKETRVKIMKATSIGQKAWDSGKNNIWKDASLNIEMNASSYASNSMVESAIWYLGDPGGNYTYTSNQAYIKERSNQVASGNDLNWLGNVGLISPSDYGFASSVCKNGAQNLFYYNSTEPDCRGSNWLYSGLAEWLLSPYYGTTNSARCVYGNGRVDPLSSGTQRSVRPTVYLKPSVKCKNCNESTAGTQSNPFKIE